MIADQKRSILRWYVFAAANAQTIDGAHHRRQPKTQGEIGPQPAKGPKRNEGHPDGDKNPLRRGKARAKEGSPANGKQDRCHKFTPEPDATAATLVRTNHAR